MKQILMVGAGSVGGFFGAQLAKANLSVSFLLRPKTLAAVKQNGLTIRSAHHENLFHIFLTRIWEAYYITLIRSVEMR